MSKSRDSITNYPEYCIFCGRPSTDEHHLLMGSRRHSADEESLTVMLCRECHSFIHDNPKASAMSKIIGQLVYEKRMVAKGESEDEAREHFRSRFSKSYL